MSTTTTTRNQIESDRGRSPTTGAGQSVQDIGRSAGQKASEAAQTTGQKAHEIAQSAGQKAQEVGQNIGQKAQDFAQSAGQKAQELAQAAGQKVQDAGHRIQDAAASVGHRAEDATAALGNRIQSAAGNVRENLPHEGFLGKASEAVADTLDQTGRYIEERNLRGMGEDITQVIRRNPIPSVLVAVGLGYLLGRTLRR